MTNDDARGGSGGPSPEAGAGDLGAQDADGLLRIDQVSEMTGLTKRTLRYYEELGLLSPPARTEGNYRLYTRDDVDHLRRIKRMRDLLGASLADIKEMVAAEEQRESTRTHYRQTSDPEERLRLIEEGEALARRQLDLVEEKMGGLEEMRAAIRARLQTYAVRRAELLARLRDEPGTNATSGTN